MNKWLNLGKILDCLIFDSHISDFKGMEFVFIIPMIIIALFVALLSEIKEIVTVWIEDKMYEWGIYE